MSLEDFLTQQATITQEAPDGAVPEQDALGAADRSDLAWVTVASGVPCLVSVRSALLDQRRNDTWTTVITGRIYLASDPTPRGLDSRHRIAVTKDGRSLGTYAVQGATDPNYLGRLIQVDVEKIQEVS